MAAPDEWISYEEGARRTGLKRPTITRMALAGRIRARKYGIGNRVEVYWPDLEALTRPRPLLAPEKGENGPRNAGTGDLPSRPPTAT